MNTILAAIIAIFHMLIHGGLSCLLCSPCILGIIAGYLIGQILGGIYGLIIIIPIAAVIMLKSDTGLLQVYLNKYNELVNNQS